MASCVLAIPFPIVLLLTMVAFSTGIARYLTVIAGLVSTSSAFTHQPAAEAFRVSVSSLSMTASASEAATHPCAVISNPPSTKTALGVIFDIDGTLADSWRLGYDATVVALKNNDFGHVPFNEEIYHATCVYPTPERLARTAGLLPENDNFESIGEELGRQFDDHYVRLVSPTTCAFYDGIFDMLQNLPKDTKLGALTNACVAYGHAVLESNCPVKMSSQDDKNNEDKSEQLFALYDRFGTINGADSVPAAKPSPDGLFQCAKELSLRPEDCIYVGDAVGDGKAARSAGMVSIGVLWGSNSEEKLRNADTFDYLCSTRNQLRDLLPQQ